MLPATNWAMSYAEIGHLDPSWGLLNKGRFITAQWISTVFDGKMNATGRF